MGKRAKKIINWIEAYSYLVDQKTKYLELSINEVNKNKAKKYREISEHYITRIEELVNARP